MKDICRLAAVILRCSFFSALVTGPLALAHTIMAGLTAVVFYLVFPFLLPAIPDLVNQYDIRISELWPVAYPSPPLWVCLFLAEEFLLTLAQFLWASLYSFCSRFVVHRAPVLEAEENPYSTQGPPFIVPAIMLLAAEPRLHGQMGRFLWLIRLLWFWKVHRAILEYGAPDDDFDEDGDSGGGTEAGRSNPDKDGRYIVG